MPSSTPQKCCCSHTHRIHVWYIYANIWGILMVNVTIYSIHGSYGIYVAMFFSIPHAFPKQKKKSPQSLVIWNSAFPGTARAKTDIQVKLGQKHPLETSSFSMNLQFYGYILDNDSMFNRDITRSLSVENYSRVPASCRGTSRRWRLSCASSWRPNPRWSSCNTPWDTMRMRSSRVQGTTWGWLEDLEVWNLLKGETMWNLRLEFFVCFGVERGWTWLKHATTTKRTPSVVRCFVSEVSGSSLGTDFAKEGRRWFSRFKDNAKTAFETRSRQTCLSTRTPTSCIMATTRP